MPAAFKRGMQTRITPEEVEAAARRLATTDRGRGALEALVTLIDTPAGDLALLDQRAFLALLGAAWKGDAVRVREAARAALSKQV